MTSTVITGRQIGNGTITDVNIAAGNKDGLPSVVSLRSLGTGSLQSCAGNDSRLSGGTSTSFCLGNGYITCSVVSSALTISIKTLSGSDPSSSSPVSLQFRNSTDSNGTLLSATITAATSLTIPSGATLGVVSGKAFNVWIVGISDGSTGFKLGAVLTTSNGVTMPLRDYQIVSTIAVSGSSNSVQTIYTSGSASSVGMRFLGFLSWSSGLTTAGTWVVPTKIQNFTPGCSLPGETIQLRRTTSSTTTTGTTIIPTDGTIPQISEGDAYLSLAIVPTLASSILYVSVDVTLAKSNVDNMTTAIFRDSTANAIPGGVRAVLIALATAICKINYTADYQLAGSTSSTTFWLRAGGGASGTTTFNGAGGSQFWGGALSSTMSIEEIMA